MGRQSPIVIAAASVFVLALWAALGSRLYAAPENDPLTPDERVWLIEHDGTIKLAPDPAAPPLDFFDEDGNYRGLTADYVRLIEKKLGFKFEVVRMPSWSELLVAAERREVDVICAAKRTPDRDAYLLFTLPFITIPEVIVTRSDVEGSGSIEDLRGKSVTMVEGYAVLEHVRDAYPWLQIKTCHDDLDGLLSVSFGRTDAMLIDLTMAAYLIEKEGIGNLRVAGRTDITIELGFASRKDWPILRSILEKGLALVTQDERDDIYQKWIRLQVAPEPFHWGWLLWTLALLCLVVLGFILWTSSLRRAVTRRTVALEENEKRFRMFVENADDAFYLSDQHGRIIDVNEAACLALGRDRDELLSLSLADVDIGAPDGKPGGAEEPVAPEESSVVETLHRRSDGSTFPVEVRRRRFGENHSPLLLSLARDITVRKQVEDERRTFEAQFQHTQKLESLGILAGGIAHDFNNILMTILGNAELAIAGLPVDAPARLSLLEIERAARRATDLATQMLAYSGRGSFVIKPIDLNDLVEDMAHLIEISISKKVDIRFDFSDSLRPFNGDSTQIRQIILNLLTNASEAIGDETGVISLATGLMDCERAFLDGSVFAARSGLTDPLPAGVYTYFRVTDSGSGIDPEALGRIFDPFFTTKFTGRGLGLSAVLGIIRGHRGALSIESEPGVGTTFTVLFPARDSAPVERVEPEPARVDDGEWQGKGTVLIADDEASVRAVGARMLEELGFKVLTAPDGRSALNIYRDNVDEIVCVLLDLTMPQFDGVQTLEELRRVNPDVRVVLCSGFNEQDVTRRLTGAGPAGFIKKPFTMGTLRERFIEAERRPPTGPQVEQTKN